MTIQKRVVTPSDFNTTQFAEVSNKITLAGAFTNPFFVDVTVDTANPLAPMYVFTQQGGGTKSVPAAVNAVNLDAAGTEYNAATMVLTIKMTDGTTDTINLIELAKTTAVGSTTIAFSGDGTSANPLSATAVVKASGGVLAGASGLEIDTAAINTLTHDVQLVDMAGNSLVFGSSTGAP